MGADTTHASQYAWVIPILDKYGNDIVVNKKTGKTVRGYGAFSPLGVGQTKTVITALGRNKNVKSGQVLD